MFCIGVTVYDVKSSLILQMSLYFNLTYFPVWLVVIIASFVAKVCDSPYKVWLDGYFKTLK